MSSLPATTTLYPPKAEPAPGPMPLYDFLYRFLHNPLRALPKQVYDQPYVIYRPRGTPGFVWLTDPALTEKVLLDRSGLYAKTRLEQRVFQPILGSGVLTAEGAHWQWQRRAMAPLFRHNEILSYVPHMAATAEAQAVAWRKAGTGWRQIDADMVDTTFTVIANTMLAGGEPAEGRVLKRAGHTYLSNAPWEMTAAILRLPRWMPHPGSWALHRASRAMRGAVGDIIRRRRAEGAAATAAEGDLLGRLLAARDPESGRPMSDDRLIDNLLTLLEAGHETTARALTWTLYILARAPEWQARVREEVVNVAGTGPIASAHVDQLAITERVIKEAMRLYPPAPVVARRPTQTVEIAGETFPPETEVIIPIYVIHRHNRLWQDPHRFDPDRFLPEEEKRILRTQYMPFGAGARICLGMSFAMVEAKVLLATFVRAATFEWDGKHEPEPISRVTLRPRGGMRLGVNPVT
jgi:cytochrome P450